MDTTGQQQPVPPPGWYPDSKMADTKRYWDGTQWTEQVAPADPPQVNINKALLGRLIGAGVLAVLIIGMIIVALDVSERDDQFNDDYCARIGEPPGC